MFCQNFETETLTSPFGFDRLTGTEAKIVLDKDGKNRFLEVRFSNPPSTYLRKVLEENAEYELSYRFRWAEMNCEYVTLGGYFFTAGRDDSGGAIVGPTLCSDGTSLGGSDSGCDGMRRLPRDTWQEARIGVSRRTTDRRVTLKIGANDFPPVVRSPPVLSLTLGIQYTSTKCTNVVVNYDDVVLRKL